MQCHWKMAMPLADETEALGSSLPPQLNHMQCMTTNINQLSPISRSLHGEAEWLHHSLLKLTFQTLIRSFLHLESLLYSFHTTLAAGALYLNLTRFLNISCTSEKATFICHSPSAAHPIFHLCNLDSLVNPAHRSGWGLWEKCNHFDDLATVKGFVEEWCVRLYQSPKAQGKVARFVASHFLKILKTSYNGNLESCQILWV